MKTHQHIAYAILVVIATGAVSACLDDAGAQSGGVTRSEFEALVDQVTALQGNQPGDKVFAGGTTTAAAAKIGMRPSATAGGVQLGTAVGFLPADVPAHQSRLFSIKSSSGYLFTVPNEPNSNGVVGLGGLGTDGSVTPLYYENNDCTGAPYASGVDVSDYGALQGVVFRLHAGTFNEAIDSPGQYFYIVAGTERRNGMIYASRRANIGSCEVASGTLPTSFLVQQNDPTVTLVESAPVQTPIALGETG